MSPAKNTTVVLEWVPYGLPEVALKSTLMKYGEVKFLKAVTHKGQGVSKCCKELNLKQDIPSGIILQGNPIKVTGHAW